MRTHPPIFQLVPQGTKTVEVIHPMGTYKYVEINDDWDETRRRLYAEAFKAGTRSIILINGGVELYEKRYSNEQPSRITENGQHGLWIYMARLLQRYGHVYVPHLKTHNDPHEYFNNPCDGMVVGYQTAALHKVRALSDGPIGRQLCRGGYDSFTVSDYFYYPLGKEVFKESGTRAQWTDAYLKSLDEI